MGNRLVVKEHGVMAKGIESRPPGHMELISTGSSITTTPKADRPAQLGGPIVSGAAKVRIAAHPGQAPAHRVDVIDWRTLDPASIRGEGIPVEELRSYQERIEELLRDGEGQYVLIVGREVVAFFPGLREAATYSSEHYRDRSVLIKKVAAVEPIHTLGGVLPTTEMGIGGENV